MAYKTVRRNGRDVLINTITGKEVKTGERIANELKYIGSGITDNFTYSDKVNRRTGQRLTPAEVRKIEGKPKKPVPRSKPGPAAENNPKGVSDPNDKETQRMLSGKPKPAEKKPAAVRPAAQQPTTAYRPSSRVSSPAPKPKAQPAPQAKANAQSYRDAADTKGLSVGRYRTLAEHRAAVQANKAMKISPKMDTKSDVYTPSTKVDGSKLDTSKVTAKTEEYDKKKRKKLS